VVDVDGTAQFQTERPRLERIAARILGDPVEAQDVVSQTWLRLHGSEAEIDNLPGWLTTVTTRLCLDRLRSRTPQPVADLELDLELAGTVPDPADDVALADTVGLALQVVLDRLTAGERVAFVLHDSFGVDFPAVAQILDVTPAAARKLASRARGKLALPAPPGRTGAPDPRPDWAVVDAFLAAAREGDFGRLLELLAPDVVVAGDAAAVALGTPARIEGREQVATFFNGAARSALPVFVGDRPGAAWFQQGSAAVAFDFSVAAGVVRRIDFRAEAGVLDRVVARREDVRR
jgi:RNA polymerase sigma factor (sigma-70 family)